jgi:WS/DGAT/MGAT family acyltransferase
VTEARTVFDRVGGLAGRAVSSTASAVRRRTPSPLAARLGEQRRVAIARTSLDDYRRVHRAHGSTVNDVVLATVSGALRRWLLYREQVVTPELTVRALVPVSVADPGDRERVTPLLVDLPVGEPDPLLRLAKIGEALAAHLQSTRSVAAGALVALSGFAPPTLHALGARAANGITRRTYALMITNVPGPQVPLYAAGARMTEMFPITPLSRGHALSIGLTSYDGGVFYGFTGDRDAMPDIDLLGEFVENSLAELLALSGEGKPVTLAAKRATSRRRNAARRPVRSPREPQL